LDLEDPLSAQAGTLRALKSRIDKLQGNHRKVIALLSFSGSTEYLNVSTNIASYISTLGSSTLVLEAAPLHLKDGNAIGEKLLSNDSELNEYIYQNDVLGVGILPNLLRNSPDIMKFLTPKNVKRFFEKIRDTYDYSFLNLPVNAATMDVSDFAENVDGFIIEGMWGRVGANNINFFMKQNHISSEKVLGLVLSSTDMNKMKNSYGHTN
jgi:Mrp family chromosome partitioning ATPase